MAKGNTNEMFKRHKETKPRKFLYKEGGMVQEWFSQKELRKFFNLTKEQISKLVVRTVA